MRRYETIVLGLGAMGSAALYHLAGQGGRVLGLDRFAPPHPYGSTHGDTRITRQAIGEGAAYAPLVLRSYELWRALERETGRAQELNEALASAMAHLPAHEDRPGRLREGGAGTAGTEVRGRAVQPRARVRPVGLLPVSNT